MDILVFYSLFIINILGVLGLFISIDFYFENKRRTFKIFSLAWIFYLISGVSSFFLYMELNQLLFLVTFFIYIITYTCCIGCFTFAFLMYFLNIKLKYFIWLFFLIMIPSILISLLFTLLLVISYLTLLGGAILLAGLILPVLNYENFRKKFRGSVKWYFFLGIQLITQIIFSVIIQILDFEFIQGELGYFLYILNDFIFTIIIMVTILILIVHLEYNIIHKEKDKLIDKYSHELGNIMQSVLSASQLINKSDKDKDELVELRDIQYKKLNEGSNIIKEIRKL